MKDRKKATTYAEAMTWSYGHLIAGGSVWCVRHAGVPGGIITYLRADHPETWESFEGQPLHLFTLTPVTLNGDVPMHGHEMNWERLARRTSEVE